MAPPPRHPVHEDRASHSSRQNKRCRADPTFFWVPGQPRAFQSFPCQGGKAVTESEDSPGTSDNFQMLAKNENQHQDREGVEPDSRLEEGLSFLLAHETASPELRDPGGVGCNRYRRQACGGPPGKDTQEKGESAHENMNRLPQAFGYHPVARGASACKARTVCSSPWDRGVTV